MPRRARRRPKHRGPEVNELEMFVFQHGRVPDREHRHEYGGSYFDAWMLTYLTGETIDIVRNLWTLVREDVLQVWARERPGELPWAERELRRLDKLAR